jgi:hypothetical protein
MNVDATQLEAHRATLDTESLFPLFSLPLHLSP